MSAPSAETEPVRWMRSLCTSEAGETVEVLFALLDGTTAQVAVVRQMSGAGSRFYVFWREDLEPLRSGPQEMTLVHALELHRRSPALVVPSQHAAVVAVSAAGPFRAVVVDDLGAPEMVGLRSAHESVSVPRAAAAAPQPDFNDHLHAGADKVVPDDGATRAAPPDEESFTAGESVSAPLPGREPDAGRPRATNGGPRRRASSPPPADRRRKAKNGGGRGAGSAVLRPAARGPRVHRTRSGRAAAKAKPRAKRTGTSDRGGKKAKKSTHGRRVGRRRTSPTRRDPPRSAYARIDAPASVVVKDDFTIKVGLAAVRQTEVSGGVITRPATSVGPYTLDVQVTALGFDLSDPGHTSWRNPLRVTAEDPYPAITLRLLALDQDAPIVHRVIEVKYALAGQPIGMARRRIAVKRSQSVRLQGRQNQKAAGAHLTLPRNTPAADLTATIQLPEGQSGGLLWTFDVAPNFKVELPATGILYPLAGSPREFADRLTTKMSELEGKTGTYAFLSASAKTVAHAIPPVFWRLLRQVAAQTKSRVPTLQLLTQEPYVPWELAAFVAPLIDAESPPFLAAQVATARWIMGSVEDPRPAYPPPAQLKAKRMAVVYGTYPQTANFGPLIDSVNEGKALVKKWKGTHLDASTKVLLTKLVKPGADVVHFACHGNFDQTGRLDGLMMVDGTCLLPEQVSEMTFGRRPLVFLNACQTGPGFLSLGDYAGMAQAFLMAGSSGVIAPLWAIDDKVSGDIAKRFYQRVFDGDLPAEYMRQQRRHFRKSGRQEPRSATWMAYVFFGHPEMRVTWS